MHLGPGAVLDVGRQLPALAAQELDDLAGHLQAAGGFHLLQARALLPLLALEVLAEEPGHGPAGDADERPDDVEVDLGDAQVQGVGRQYAQGGPEQHVHRHGAQPAKLRRALLEVVHQVVALRDQAPQLLARHARAPVHGCTSASSI